MDDIDQIILNIVNDNIILVLVIYFYIALIRIKKCIILYLIILRDKISDRKTGTEKCPTLSMRISLTNLWMEFRTIDSKSLAKWLIIEIGYIVSNIYCISRFMHWSTVETPDFGKDPNDL